MPTRLSTADDLALTTKYVRLNPIWRLASYRTGMLKISIKDGKVGRLLVLEGKLIAPWSPRLIEIACQDRANHLDREFVLDLRGVTDISAAEEEALTFRNAMPWFT